MSNIRTNYVIGAWSGKRNAHRFGKTTEDGLVYLQAHINQLLKLRHSLTQITIAHAGEIVDPAYKSYVDALLRTYNDIKFIDGPITNCISYGSFSNAYTTYGDSFDYYFFIEDDYAPVLNDFDKELIALFNEVPDTKCLMTLFRLNPECLISNCVTTPKTLKEIFDKHGCLMNPNERNYHQYQRIFSYAFHSVGPVRDWSHKYKTPFWNSTPGQMLEFSDPSVTDYIIIPYQMLIK